MTTVEDAPRSGIAVVKLPAERSMSAATAAASETAASEREIYRDLVETLFATKGAFASGLAAGMFPPAIAWLSSGELVYFYLLMMMACFAGYRLAVFTAYAQRPFKQRREEAQRWEKLYAVGGIAYLSGVGVSCAIIFSTMNMSMVAYYGVIVMAGFTGTIASRNAARPWIVFGQAVGASMPLALVSLFKFDIWYWGLSAILVIALLAIRSTTSFLHSVLETALRNGYEARNQKQRLKLALNSMTHGLCMGDGDLSVSVINRRVFDFFGIVAAATPIQLDALAHAIGRSANMSPAAIDLFVARWRRHAMMQTANVFTHQIGDRFFDFNCVQADAGGFVTVIEDVTAQKRALNEIERIARYDELTSLPNRYQFQDTLREELSQLHEPDREVALLTIDLDRFKEVNDTLGHAIGDQLLVAVGKRLSECVQPPDVLARLGGDEFCVLLRGSQDVADSANNVTARILAAIKQPFFVDNNTIGIGASIGIALAPIDATTPAELLKCSDLALYHTKERGRGKAAFFTTDMQANMTHKRQIESDLKRAVEAEELKLYYQPVIDSRSGKVIAIEALMRWPHARGMVSPAEFIPIAEETGMIIEMGEWALRRACLDALSLAPDIRVSVNLAPRQFQQHNLPQVIAMILQETGLPADRLELEITESTLMLAHDDVENKLREINSLGVRLALDDFGTGYSSLSYLNRFPVRKVKIDRSFTRQAIEFPKTQAIINAISTLARDLEMDVVAEGVETVEQLTFMGNKNIFYIQGFYYSPALPLEELASRYMLDASALNAA